MVFMPAVRVDTDWNSAAISFPGTESPPMLAGLSHSISAMSAAPPSHRITEKLSTTFACRDRRCFLWYSPISTQTIKPRPPEMIMNITTACT